MKKRMIASLILALAASVCLAFSAFGEEGVTDTEIHIGQWGPQTGPAAPWGSVARGSDAYFKMINAEGGIHGRKIVHHYFDDAYNPAKTKAGVKELQESSHGIFAWVGGVGSSTGMAVKDYLMDRKVPWVAPSAGNFVWLDPPQKYLFAVYSLYIVEAMALTRYAVEDLNLKKIAIVYQNDEYGKNGVKGMKRQLAKYGLEPALTIPWNLGDNDLKPHTSTLKKSGAEAVLLWITPGAVVRSLFTAKAMRFKPQWMVPSPMTDFKLMYKISRGLFEGVITVTFGAMIANPNPLMQKYKRDGFDKFAAKGERWGTFFAAGMGYGETLAQGLKRAGRNLTRETFVAEMEKMRNFKGILGAISYKPFDVNDPSSRQGIESVFLVQCLKNGQEKKLTGWIKPDFDYK